MADTFQAAQFDLLDSSVRSRSGLYFTETGSKCPRQTQCHRADFRHCSEKKMVDIDLEDSQD